MGHRFVFSQRDVDSAVELSPAVLSALGALNQAQLYHVWFGVGGDARMVQRATGVRAEVVEALAHDFGWHALAGGKAGLADKKVEKEINRAMAFAQGKRLAAILDRAMQIVEENPERLKASMFTTTEDGRQTLSAKPLVELAKAAEITQSILYRALGDKLAEEADTVAGNIDRIKSLSLTVANIVGNAAARAHAGNAVTEAIDVSDE